MMLRGGIKHSSLRLTREDIVLTTQTDPVRLREGLSVLEDNQSNLSTEQVAPSRRNLELDKENMYFPNEESGNRA